MKPGLIALAFMASLAACTQVQGTEAEAVTVAANGEELVCERVDIPGKLYPGKVCMTQAQWDRQKENARDAAGTIQRKALGTGDPNAG